MFAAVLTTFCFACSVILARRSTLFVGNQPANLGRQLVALVFLALWAHTLGQGLRGPGLGVFIVSGVIGFGTALAVDQRARCSTYHGIAAARPASRSWVGA